MSQDPHLFFLECSSLPLFTPKILVIRVLKSRVDELRTCRRERVREARHPAAAGNHADLALRVARRDTAHRCRDSKLGSCGQPKQILDQLLVVAHWIAGGTVVCLHSASGSWDAPAAHCQR